MKKADRLLKILLKRAEAENQKILKIQQIINSLLKHQEVLATDRSRQIGYLAPRGVGKTWGIMAKALIEAISGGSIAYVAKTLQSAKESGWPTLLQLVKEHNVYCDRINNSELRVIIGEGQIKCFGADNKYLKDNIRGSRWSLIIVDEAGHYYSDLARLVREVLIPATFARRGSLVLSGTPTYVPSGLFHNITTQPNKAWSIHKIHDPFCNPDSKQDVLDQIELWKKEFGPKWSSIPFIRRELYGEWTNDLDKLVYKYSYNKNTYIKTPKLNKIKYLAGLDFSFTGSTGWVETISSENTKCIFVEKALNYKNIGLDQVDKLGPILNDWNKRTNGADIIYDHAQQFIADKLLEIYPNLSLIPAKKTNKYQHIELFNADLQTSRILLKNNNCGDLINEYNLGDWKTNRDGTEIFGEPKQNPLKKWDTSDALLYVWRETRHREYEKKDKPPKYGSEEWFKKQEQDILNNLKYGSITQQYYD